MYGETRLDKERVLDPYQQERDADSFMIPSFCSPLCKVLGFLDRIQPATIRNKAQKMFHLSPSLNLDADKRLPRTSSVGTMLTIAVISSTPGETRVTVMALLILVENTQMLA